MLCSSPAPSSIIDVSLSHSSIVYLPLIALHLRLSSPVSISSSSPSPSAAAQSHQQHTHQIHIAFWFSPSRLPSRCSLCFFSLSHFLASAVVFIARLIGLYHTVILSCFVLLFLPLLSVCPLCSAYPHQLADLVASGTAFPCSRGLAG